MVPRPLCTSSHPTLTHPYKVGWPCHLQSRNEAQRVDPLAKFPKLAGVQLEVNEVWPAQGHALMPTRPRCRLSFVLGIPCPTFGAQTLSFST